MPPSAQRRIVSKLLPVILSKLLLMGTGLRVAQPFTDAIVRIDEAQHCEAEQRQSRRGDRETLLAVWAIERDAPVASQKQLRLRYLTT